MSTALHVVALITGKPGTGDQLEPALTALAEATHGHDGCLLYSLQRGTQDRDVFVTVEKWLSAEHLQRHLETDDVKGALSGEAGALLAGPPQIVTTTVIPVGDPAMSDY